MDIDAVRDFWDRRPCNIKHSKAVILSEQWSKEVTERKYFVEPHIRRFADFPRWNGKQVLEIGCGVGTDSLEFLRNGALLDAVDLSPVSAYIAKERCKEYKNGRFIFDNAENGLLDYRNGYYDLVYSFGVIHHTPYPEKIVKTAWHKLKQGGEFRLMLYAKWSIKNLTRQQPEAQAGCPIAKKYTARSVKQLLNGKFKVKSIEKTHIFKWRVKNYVDYEYVPALPYSLMPQPMFNALERMLGWHLLVIAEKI